MRSKQDIREFISRRSNSSSIKMLRSEAFIAGQKFIGHFGDYESFLVYLDHRRELATGRLITNLLSMGRSVYVPIVSGDTLKCAPYNGANRQKMHLNQFGIWEPVEGIVDIDVDVIVVPCVACDASGNRIGYGKGYYDRALRNFKGITVCLAYSFQVMDSLEDIVEPHDVTMNYILTDKKIYGGMDLAC